MVVEGDHIKKLYFAVPLVLLLLCLVYLAIHNGKGGLTIGASTAKIGLLHTDGLDIVDESGKKVLLKGFCITNNVWGHWQSGVSEKLQARGDDPLIRPREQDAWVLNDEDFSRLAMMGLNCVRYCFNYQLFSNDNAERESNIRRMIAHIERFADMGVYTIPVLMMAPGLDTQNDIAEREKTGVERVKSVFEDEGIFGQCLDMWRYVASELVNVKGLAGYELINEPRLPCNAEGGVEIYRERLTILCNEIRKLDARHIIFVPEYNSKEANPGEQYWNSHNGGFVTDRGEEGIIWETGFVKADIPNIVYVFHYYGSYDFAAYGIGAFDGASMKSCLGEKVQWAEKTGKAPLICTEYGISRINEQTVRISWLEEIHKLFDDNGISATFFSYKGPLGANIDPKKEFWPVYAEYENWEHEIFFRENGTYMFFDAGLKTAAENNNFISDLEKYFIQDGKIKRISLMDNGPVLDCLEKYWD